MRHLTSARDLSSMQLKLNIMKVVLTCQCIVFKSNPVIIQPSWWHAAFCFKTCILLQNMRLLSVIFSSAITAAVLLPSAVIRDLYHVTSSLKYKDALRRMPFLTYSTATKQCVFVSFTDGENLPFLRALLHPRSSSTKNLDQWVVFYL